MANTKATSIKNNHLDDVKSLSDLDRIFTTYRHSSSQHKSFDFSNVSLFGENGDYANEATDLRRFHQMSLYIQIPQVHWYGKQAETLADTIILTSNLPESISYSIGSDWAAPLQSFGSATSNLLMQMAGPKLGVGINSGVPRATSFRIWNGSKPLSLDLKIPVIDDGKTGSNTNLMEALDVLSAVVLPKYSSSGFYIPPPSPLKVGIHYATDFQDGKPAGTETFNLPTGQGGRIMLQLGGILLVDYCIIESFSINYPNTKTLIRHDYTKDGADINYGETGKVFLHPLLAEISLKISTVEAVTADTYSKMLWARPQENMGKGNFDLSTGLAGYITAGFAKGAESVKKAFGG